MGRAKKLIKRHSRELNRGGDRGKGLIIQESLLACYVTHELRNLKWYNELSWRSARVRHAFFLILFGPNSRFSLCWGGKINNDAH